MFPPVLSAFLLALSTQVLANNGASSYSSTTEGHTANNDASSYSSTTARTAHATLSYSSSSYSPPAVSTYTTSTIPIYSCIYFVTPTSTSGAYLTALPGISSVNYTASSSEYHGGNGTYTTLPEVLPTYSSIKSHVWSSSSRSASEYSPSPTGIPSYSSYSADSPILSASEYSPSPTGIPSHSSYSAYSSIRPLTSTVYASLYTANGTISTAYATASLSFPTGLPICGEPYYSGNSSTSTSSSVASSSTSGTAFQANAQSDGKTNSAFTIKKNVAGLALGAVAGVALTML